MRGGFSLAAAVRGGRDRGTQMTTTRSAAAPAPAAGQQGNRTEGPDISRSMASCGTAGLAEHMGVAAGVLRGRRTCRARKMLRQPIAVLGWRDGDLAAGGRLPRITPGAGPGIIACLPIGRRRLPASGGGQEETVMSRFVRRVLTTATVAALALTTAGFTGAGAAMVASRATGPAVYSDQHAGYQAAGRWFRYVATTVTVPPARPPLPGIAAFRLHRAEWQVLRHGINVDPRRGGRRTALAMPPPTWAPGRSGSAPRVGDRLAISIYYDQRGHTIHRHRPEPGPPRRRIDVYTSGLADLPRRPAVQTDRCPV